MKNWKDLKDEAASLTEEAKDFDPATTLFELMEQQKVFKEMSYMAFKLREMWLISNKDPQSSLYRDYGFADPVKEDVLYNNFMVKFNSAKTKHANEKTKSNNRKAAKQAERDKVAALEAEVATLKSKNSGGGGQGGGPNP